ncbi:tRNA (N6-isopentenyl adenosine(37)-C2)-methylthiotransferase MiaB [Candidatus Marinimicrobia bacterium]|nr:tRNA (N6-isopentenyl adenosine(37)-C2)-methylthiotransferase MiaB [Candidatus Neomarinimicrobiota bacterium]
MENTQIQEYQDLTKKRNSAKTYHIDTYGCQMNVADSELVEAILISEGYKKSIDINSADAIFVNTCAIREQAEEKIHSQLGRYNLIKRKKPEILIGVLGCMAQNLKDDLLENKPYIDIVLGPDSYRELPKILNQRKRILDSIVDTKLSRYEVYQDLFPHRKGGANAWVSIMRGCDKFCTFCIVPFTRGRERSRNLESILQEAKDAVDNGYSEITLLGQNVNSYDYQNLKFHDLLEEVSKIKKLKRIRYTSPHPQDITEELLRVMAKHENICDYIHLPLQAGSNRILKRMNRTYTREHFISLVKMIREILPKVGISTDIIVGFPGETSKDFEETISLMHEVKFDSAFNFKYSSRPGTKASEYSERINDQEKKDRLQKIINLQKKHTLERNKILIGSIQDVLIEKESKLSATHWAGRTDSNKWVVFDKKNSQINKIVQVKIKEARGVTLHGELLNKIEAA